MPTSPRWALWPSWVTTRSGSSSASLVAEFGAPILSSTFIRPGQEEPETNGWEIQESLGHLIDVVIEGPVGQGEPTSVIDLTDDVPEVLREGAGDISLL